MKARIAEKFKSQDGATLLFALLALVVVVMVSIVILGAAVSGVTRLNREKALTQQQLTLESAAQLVAGCVNDGITYTTTETVIVSEGDRYGEVISESAEECNPSRFSAYIKEGTTYVETFGSNFSTGSMTVKEGDSSVDVAMTLAHGEHPEEQADKNYLLSFEFTMSDSTESIMMYMECSNKSTDVTKRGTYEETDGSGKKVTYDTETREVKYTWAAPELQAYAGSEN